MTIRVPIDVSPHDALDGIERIFHPPRRSGSRAMMLALPIPGRDSGAPATIAGERRVLVAVRCRRHADAAAGELFSLAWEPDDDRLPRFSGFLTVEPDDDRKGRSQLVLMGTFTVPGTRRSGEICRLADEPLASAVGRAFLRHLLNVVPVARIVPDGHAAHREERRDESRRGRAVLPWSLTRSVSLN